MIDYGLLAYSGFHTAASDNNITTDWAGKWNDLSEEERECWRASADIVKMYVRRERMTRE